MPNENDIKIAPNSEAVTTDNAVKTEYHYFNEHLKSVHKARTIYKKRPLIRDFPYSYSGTRGLSVKKVSEVELRGWDKFEDLPTLIKPSTRISLTHQKIYPLMKILYARYPKLNKLIIIKAGGTTRFSEKTATFAFEDLRKICLAINKEIVNGNSRRKSAAQNGLAEVSTQFTTDLTPLQKGSLAHFLSLHNDETSLSSADVDAVLRLISHVPFGNVTVTENFIETRNQINVAYLDNVIDRFETLLDVKGDNEADWQDFFAEYGWILASVFPYQVILHEKEAYVGGKTIGNDDGRVVDFLYQNGFRDNYALLEIKTHNKALVAAKAYREPEAFAQHSDCAGAVSQCLDQKSTFLATWGGTYKILDPKVALIIGRKDKLTAEQATAFELMRNNQKNVDIISFDELLEKLHGLRSILQAQA